MTLNTICPCTIRCRASSQHAACLLSAASASCDTLIRNSIVDETSGWLLSLHELGIQGDGDVITHQNSAGLEGSVPRQTEVLAIDLGARRDPNPSVPPGILGRRRWPFHRKAHFARHP